MGSQIVGAQERSNDKSLTKEYYFRRLGPEYYSLAKFQMSKEPTAVYTIRRMRCNCWSAIKYQQCPHIPMLKAWISRGRPMMFPFVFGKGGNDVCS